MSRELQIHEECLLWGLKSVNGAHFGMFGVPGICLLRKPEHFISEDFQQPPLVSDLTGSAGTPKWAFVGGIAHSKAPCSFVVYT